MEADVNVFDWQRILVGLPPPWYMLEIVFRVLMIFLVLMLVVRLMGKRGQRDLSPMQNVLLIALGSAAGDTMLYPDVPLTYAALILLGATVSTVALEWVSEHWQPMRDYLESRPRVLVRNGEVDFEALRKERTTRRELYAELRTKGASSLSQVDAAVLEVTGDISVFLNDRKPEHKDLLEYVLDPDRHSPPQCNGDTEEDRA